MEKTFLNNSNVFKTFYLSLISVTVAVSNMVWNHSKNSGWENSVHLSTTQSIFLVFFTSLQIITGTLSNGFVIVTFLAARELRRRPSDLFILNLAVADLIFLTTFQPWLTHVLNQKAVLTFEAEYYVYESLGCFVNLSSQHAIMLIAIDRLLAVVLPLRYKTLVTRKVIYISIIISWTFALLFSLVNYFAYIFKFYLTFLGFWTSFQLVLMLGIILIYTFIFTTTLKMIRKSLRQRGMFHLQNEHIQYRTVFKITLNTMILVCLFYTTFLPIIISIGHRSLVLELGNEYQMVTRSWIYSFSSLNSCINPFIYALRTKRFKKASFRFWCNITYRTSTIN